MRKGLLNNIVSAFGFAAWLGLGVVRLPAQDDGLSPRKITHIEQGRQLAAQADVQNLEGYRDRRRFLVLPGLVADRRIKRVEVMVTGTGLGGGEPCEFAIIDRSSDHAYEALLISWAKPSDVDKALRFIGAEPGQPFDPGSLRFWGRGEAFTLNIVGTNARPVRLERFLKDRRTGRPLPEASFLFTGSKLITDPDVPTRRVYECDVAQPKALISVFNSTCSVLQVPYRATKEDVYQNTIRNEEQPLPGEALMRLILAPAGKHGSQRATDLVLEVEPGRIPIGPSPNAAVDALANLSLKLKPKHSRTLLNKQPTLISVIETLAALDRTQHDYYLTVRFGNDLELGQVRAVARVLSGIDSERGVRIEPPPAGRLYYGAFNPDSRLLDRDARLYDPWELSLGDKDGAVVGTLLRIEREWKPGASVPELNITRLPARSAKDLRRELDVETEHSRTTDKPPKAGILMVFASSGLRYGLLTKFLELALPTHKMVHVYLDRPPL